MWKACGFCIRTTEPSKPDVPDFPRSSDLPPTNQSSAYQDQVLWIGGEAAVWLGSGEKEWKEKVTAAFKAVLPVDLPQWIDVDFRFLQERLYRKDIDNLLTPVLESARDGGWVERGFGWLGSVTARKNAVANQSEVGVLITLRSKPPVLVPNRLGILIEVPLSQLDADPVKWALYERAFDLFQRRPELRFPPQCPMTVELQATIDNAAKRKSIAALMKPCIDGLEPILGHPTNVLPQPREALQRRLAPQDEMIISFTFHVRGGASSTLSALIAPNASPSRNLTEVFDPQH